MIGAVDIPYKAMLSLVVGQKSQAREILMQLVEAKPENIMARLCLAIASPRNEAKKILQEILELDPTNPVALRNLKRLQQDPQFELDLETFWAKEDLIRPRPTTSLPTTRRVLVAVPPLKTHAISSPPPENPEPAAELAEFGQELPTMQIEAGLAEFGEQIPTMPGAFMKLMEIVKTIEQADIAAPPNYQPAEILPNWSSSPPPAPASELNSVMDTSKVEAEKKPAAVVFEAIEVTHAQILRPEQVVGHEAEILERYRPQVEPLRQTALAGAATNSVFSLFTVISLLIAIILIGLVIYTVWVINAPNIRF